MKFPARPEAHFGHRLAVNPHLIRQQLNEPAHIN